MKVGTMDVDGAVSVRVRQIAAGLLSDGSAADEPDAILAAMRVIAAADRLPGQRGRFRDVRKARPPD